MLDRCGLEWYRVQADVGMMGGFGAHEYMAPCPAGENDVALAGGYAANVEVASADAQPVRLPAALDAPEEVATPGMTTIDAVAQELSLPAGALLKAFPAR
jgi:prolyl-tRNA synthetase